MLRLFLFTALVVSNLSAHHAVRDGSVTNFNKFLVPGRYTGALRLEDQERRFIIVTPTGASMDEPRPIIFFFHGSGSSAEQAARTYGWIEKAAKERCFILFPQGLPARRGEPSSFRSNPSRWNDGRADQAEATDDATFFSTLLDKLQEVLPIDRRRVFVTGFSNGAAMTFALGARFSDRIAAIAPVSSQSFVSVEHLARPLPVYYLVGTADPLVPFHGGTSVLWGALHTTEAVQKSAEQWARLDGCPAKPEMVSQQDGVRILRYGPGRDEAEVLFTIVEGNGHHWPVSVEPLPRTISGPTLDPFSATDRIWDFFRRHPLPDSSH